MGSVLQQRQERESSTMQYCLRLECAIREQSLFPQITARVNELALLDNADQKKRSTEEFKCQVECDIARKDLEVLKLDN